MWTAGSTALSNSNTGEGRCGCAFNGRRGVLRNMPSTMTSSEGNDPAIPRKGATRFLVLRFLS